MINPSVSMIHLQLPPERRVLELTRKKVEDLIACAEGHTLDPDPKDFLDRWLFDYSDRDLEGECIDVADDLEALMRRNKNVAMLVAEKTEEKRLHKRICAYAGRVFARSSRTNLAASRASFKFVPTKSPSVRLRDRPFMRRWMIQQGCRPLRARGPSPGTVLSQISRSILSASSASTQRSQLTSLLT